MAAGNEQISASLRAESSRSSPRGQIMSVERCETEPHGQTLKQKNLPSPIGIDRGVGHEAIFDHGKTIERGPLPYHHPALLPAPMGFLVAPTQQMRRRAFDPTRVNSRHRTGVDSGGLHDLRRHHPGGIAAEHARAREDMEAQAPSPEVILALRAGHRHGAGPARRTGPTPG